MLSQAYLSKFLCILLFITGLLACRTEPTKQTEAYNAETLGRDPAVLVVRQESEPPMLTPLLTTNGYATEVMAYLFQPLMEYHPVTLKYTPVLIEHEPEAKLIMDGPYAGGEVYTMRLRENAQWGDGKPVTVEDYIFTLKVVFNKRIKTAYRGVLIPVKAVEMDANDSRTFSVTVSPTYFLSLDIATNFPVYPKHIYDPQGIMDAFSIEQLQNMDADDPAMETLQQFADAIQAEKYARDPAFVKGSGPYELSSWQTGQQILISKKKDWWGDALAAENDYFKAIPEKIAYKFISDIPATIASVKAQDIDIAVLAPNREMQEARDNELVNTHYNTDDIKIVEMYWLTFNTRRPKLSDKRVRRAIAHLLDVEQLLQEVALGRGERMHSPYHPSDAHFSNRLPFIEFSVEKAKQLLDEAGWKDSDGDGIRDKLIQGAQTPLSLEFLVSPKGAAGKSAALLLKNSAIQAGVEIVPVFKDFRMIAREHRATRDFDLLSGGTRRSPSSFDPYQRFHTDSDNPNGSNYSGFGNAASDAVIDSIRFGSPQARASAYQRFEEIVYDEQPLIFLYTPWRTLFAHKRYKEVLSKRRPGYFVQYFEEESSR